jgi:hypothetical protein
MRSVGGAGIGLAAGLLGCFPMPPPDPGRPGPVPSTPAPAAAAPAVEMAVEWDAAAGAIRCRSTKVAVPEQLRGQVRWTNTDELAILPAGDPAGAALVVGLLEANDAADDPPSFLADAMLTWLRLQLLAGGGLVGPVEMSLDGNTSLEESRVVAAYTLGDRRGKAVYLQIDGCRIAALDFRLPSDRPRLTGMLDRLQAEIAAKFPETFFQRRERARFNARARRAAATNRRTNRSKASASSLPTTRSGPGSTRTAGPTGPRSSRHAARCSPGRK